MQNSLSDQAEPDYTSVSFILQNLSLCTPKISEEGDALLQARRDVAKNICFQICFYVYCVLHAFKDDFDNLKAPPAEEGSSKITIRS